MTEPENTQPLPSSALVVLPARRDPGMYGPYSLTSDEYWSLLHQGYEPRRCIFSTVGPI